MGDFNQDARKRLDSILGKPDPDARIAALESENAELKLRLKEYADTTAEHHKSENAAWAENAELRTQIESERMEYRDAANEGAKRSQEEIKDVRAENERLRKTLAVAYDREAESDDENARTIARLRKALRPLVRYTARIKAGMENSVWDGLDGRARASLASPFTKAELDKAAAAEEGE